LACPTAYWTSYNRAFNKATPAEDGWTIKLKSASAIFSGFLKLCAIIPSNHCLPDIYKDALQNLLAIL